MRNDLNMRKGKMIAQGAHAAMIFLTERLMRAARSPEAEPLELSAEQWEWLVTGRMTKICVRVDSEDELLALYEKAQTAKVEAHLITDSGKTEFSGVPTRTCLALGPDESAKIDAISGHLQLL